MVNKALASKFCGDVSNRAEICGKDAGVPSQFAVHDITLSLDGDL